MQGYPLDVILLRIVTGLHHAVNIKVSHAEIRTTHLTGIVTDIGIVLGKPVYWNADQTATQSREMQTRSHAVGDVSGDGGYWKHWRFLTGLHFACTGPLQ
jgi:hypothetical protein